jgi:hypothetical protein
MLEAVFLWAAIAIAVLAVAVVFLGGERGSAFLDRFWGSER